MLAYLLAIASVVSPPFVWVEEKIELPYELRLHDSKEAVIEKLNKIFAPCHSQEQRVGGLTGEVWFVRCQGYSIAAAGFTSDTPSDIFGLSEFEFKLNENGKIPGWYTQESASSRATTFSPNKDIFLGSVKYAVTTPPFFRKDGQKLERELVVEIDKANKTILFQEWMAWNYDIRVRFVNVNAANPQICFGIACFDVTVSSPSYGRGVGGTGGGIGCGSRGGPGFRKANGQCASWRDLGR